MEPKNGGLEDVLFLFNWVIFRFQPLIFRGWDGTLTWWWIADDVRWRMITWTLAPSWVAPHKTVVKALECGPPQGHSGEGCIARWGKGTKIIHRLKDGYRLYVVYSPRFVDYFQEGEEISQKVWLVQEKRVNLVGTIIVQGPCLEFNWNCCEKAMVPWEGAVKWYDGLLELSEFSNFPVKHHCGVIQNSRILTASFNKSFCEFHCDASIYHTCIIWYTYYTLYQTISYML